MVLLISCCWFCITASLFLLSGFFIRHFYRIIKGECSSREDDFALLSMKKLRPLQPLPGATEFKETDYEKVTSDFDFKFRFLITEDVMRRKDEPEFSNNSPFLGANISKYGFLSEKDFSGFMDEPEAMTYCVQESYADSKEDHLVDTRKSEGVLKTKFLSVKDFRPFAVPEEEVPNNTSTSVFSVEKKSEESKSASVISLKNQLSTKVRLLNSVISLDAADEICSLLGEDFYELDTDSDMTSVSNSYSVKDLIIDSNSDGFLTERDFGEDEHESETTSSTTMDLDKVKEDFFDDSQKFGETHLQNSLVTSRDLNRQHVKLLIYKGVHLKIFCNSNLQPLKSVSGLSRKTLGFSEHEGEIDRLLEEDMVENQLQNWFISDSEIVSPEFETYSFYGNKSMSSLKYWRVVRPENVSMKPEHTVELLNGEQTELPSNCKIEEVQLPNSVNFEKESFHVAINGLPLFNNKVFREPHLETRDLDEEETAGTGKSEDIHTHNSQNSNVLSGPTNDSQRSGTKLLDDLGQASEDISGKEFEPQKGVQKSKEAHKNKSSELDMEDSNELECLWEHQDLIEQLKMELKKVRAIGLPTIFEESESPKMIEDLKPWIDSKFLHEDPIDELHKVYKSYRERMRKFDILNYQKMYTIGFLQLKDPLQSMGTQKPLIPAITSVLFHNLWPSRSRKSNNQPSEKFINDLQSDLEMVYVGQSCLSWEFLRWQYEKARELSESDPYGSRQYNQVAGEFQQFQVVMQRFLENEPFLGTRVQNYVKNRCVLQNLLQVPVIKEDCLKDKTDEVRKGNNTITIQLLEDIMEESIMLFWEFVKADKNETRMILKGLAVAGPQAGLQDPKDIEFMVDVKANLHKKVKKLRELLRTGNCLVRKFKKPQEDRSNKDLFCSQVDLKLVSRVLKMSRLTTDQLAWCRKKLNKITFVERKLHREPSFLLFPC